MSNYLVAPKLYNTGFIPPSAAALRIKQGLVPQDISNYESSGMSGQYVSFELSPFRQVSVFIRRHPRVCGTLNICRNRQWTDSKI